VSAVHVHARVGREAYAIPVTHVVEVVELGELTPLAGAGSHVLGMRNLRGQVIPVFDLGALLGAGGGALPARICVASRGAQVAGLAVDEVTDVAALPSECQDADSPLLAGSVLVDGRLLGVIDADELFAELERRGGR
jgi:purine-binding chemotaxis protein CheW